MFSLSNQSFSWEKARPHPPGEGEPCESRRLLVLGFSWWKPYFVRDVFAAVRADLDWEKAVGQAAWESAVAGRTEFRLCSAYCVLRIGCGLIFGFGSVRDGLRVACPAFVRARRDGCGFCRSCCRLQIASCRLWDIGLWMLDAGRCGRFSLLTSAATIGSWSFAAGFAFGSGMGRMGRMGRDRVPGVAR